MNENPPPMTLETLLATYPNTSVLKSGVIESELVKFAFADIDPANRGFKSLVRDARFDLSELAIVTYLQAKVYGKPYVLLPAVIVGRGQHHTLAYNPENGHRKPEDLNGCRIGVRAYTQTTGTWLRGILEEDYGVDTKSIRWITFEDPHLAEYIDPPWVERAPAGKDLVQMLLAGEIDAAIVGDKLPDPRLKHLIPDPDAAARRWAEAHGGIPMNHMLVMRESIVSQRPDVVKEVYRLAKQSASMGPATKEPAAIRFGVDACRSCLEVIIDYSVRQGLIPRHFEVEELFNDVTRVL